MPDHRELIHQLNQRYYREWLRAEQLQRDLTRLQASWLGPLAGWLRTLKRRCFPASGESHHLPHCPTIREGPLPVDATVSVIIPFRDRLELLKPCLRSLRTTHGPLEVILVDNGSQDPRLLRHLDRLQQRRRAKVVSSPGAFNFSLLCNTGARQAKHEYLLFLNNDTEICHPDWLNHLLRVASRPDVGVTGATLLYPDQTIQHAGLFPDATGRWVHAGRGLPVDTPALAQIRVVPAVSAACLLVRRQLFHDLGGFDERLPVTYNDVALCQRVRERGQLVVVTPHARVLHYEGLSRGFSGDTPGATHLAQLNAFPSPPNGTETFRSSRSGQGWQGSS